MRSRVAEHYGNGVQSLLDHLNTLVGRSVASGCDADAFGAVWMSLLAKLVYLSARKKKKCEPWESTRHSRNSLYCCEKSDVWICLVSIQRKSKSA